MDKGFKEDLGRSARSLAGLLFLVGIPTNFVVKKYKRVIDPYRISVINHYDGNENGKIDKNEKRSMMGKLGYEFKKNYKFTEEDFKTLYEELK